MSATAQHDRMLDLLSDRALVGLDQTEEAELAHLIVSFPDAERIGRDMELTAAAIALAGLERITPLPDQLFSKVDADSQDGLPTRVHRLVNLHPSATTGPGQVVSARIPAPVTKKSEPSATPTDATMRPRPGPAGASGPQEEERRNEPPMRIQSTAQMPPAQSHPTHGPPPVGSHAQPPPTPSGAPFGYRGPQQPPPFQQQLPPSPPHGLPIPSQPLASFPQGQPYPGQVVPLPRGPGQSQAAARSGRGLAVTGWLAAAACLLLAAGAWYFRPRTQIVTVTVPGSPLTPLPSVSVSVPPTPAADREGLLAQKGTARLDWAKTKDPASKQTTGDVVWNANEQRGYMRFRGLAKNDRRASVYQLWIFDKTREDKYPVDGGVFDVDDESGDVLVPIKAKLPVGEVTLFAVTVEKPGGVVVSKRERIVVTARPVT